MRKDTIEMANFMELTFVSHKTYADPFNEIELDVEFKDPQGQIFKVPAFWAGGNTWRVRYVPAVAGKHSYQLSCSDRSNASLHGQAGELEVKVVPANPLLRHLRVSDDHRHLERADGSPFFWLGDTWWLGLCARKGWGLPEFTTLARDRVEKGFTIIQIVAGLYPDLPPFDPRGYNEAGYPWEAEYARINPAYFDKADLRIERLVEEGLVPCLVASWGYHLPWLGVERMKKHWRYMIARWGVHPAVWCLAGEGAMPYYLSEHRDEDTDFQKKGWTEIGHYVRAIDPYHHPVTIHPTSNGRDTVEDDSVLDIDMLQTGHGDWKSVPNTVDTVNREYARKPFMPVINGEVSYEGHMQISWHGVQRFMFWSNVLSGAAGHTYGAGGIWQMNTREQPHGPSPHGGTYENTPWDVAAQLPGSRQLGLGKALLMRYRWWCFESHPEWVEPGWNVDNYMLPYAAGIPGQLRMVYIPSRIYQWQGPLIKELEKDVTYRGFYFDPIKGEEHDLGPVTGDEGGHWQAPWVPVAQDWVLVLERRP
jgi:hypothetical protein